MSFAANVSVLKHRSRRLGHWPVLAVLGAAISPGALKAQAAQAAAPISARAKGSATAPVTVYEMADFQCPICKRFVAENFPALEKEFVATGKVRWVFINFPLTQVHANAATAAEFAACTMEQGKFWQTHDMLYGMQDQWEKLKDPVPFFRSRMAPLGLKVDQMNRCLQSGAGAAIVRDDAAGSARAGATGTPTFYIEGGLMVGMYPLEMFRQILDSVYIAKTKKK